MNSACASTRPRRRRRTWQRPLPGPGAEAEALPGLELLPGAGLLLGQAPLPGLPGAGLLPGAADTGGGGLVGGATPSYQHVRQPIYRTSVGRAQKFAKHLGPLMEGLSGSMSREPKV